MPDFDLPDRMALRPLRREAVSDGEFRTAMSSIASSVHVVTGRRGDERVGRTVTSVMSLSAHPPAILVSIDIVSRLADIVARTGGFSLSMLSAGQMAVANAFAGQVAAPERFSVGNWSQWPSGQPLLQDAAMVLDCEVIGSMETGTHVLFAGAVIEAEANPLLSPLLWHRRGYHGVGGLD